MSGEPRRRDEADGRRRKDGKRFFYVMVPLDLNGENHPDYHPRYGSLYIAIASICDFRTKRGWARRETLKRRSGITRNDHFYAARNWLVEHGYIDVIEGGGRAATSYILLERTAITFGLWDGKPDPDWDRIVMDAPADIEETPPQRAAGPQKGEVEIEGYPQVELEGSGFEGEEEVEAWAAAWAAQDEPAGREVRHPGTGRDRQDDPPWDTQPGTGWGRVGGTRQDSHGGTGGAGLGGTGSDTYQQPSPTTPDQQPSIITDGPEAESHPGEETAPEDPRWAETPEWADLPERARMTLEAARSRYGDEIAEEAAKRYRQAAVDKERAGGQIASPGAYMLAVVESVVAERRQRRGRVLAHLRQAAENPSVTGQQRSPEWWDREAGALERRALAWIYANRHLSRQERLAGVAAILEGGHPAS